MLKPRFKIALISGSVLCALVLAFARTPVVAPLMLKVRGYRIGSPTWSNYLGMQIGSECIQAIIEGSNTTSRTLICRVSLGGSRTSEGRLLAAPSRYFASDSAGGWREQPRIYHPG